MTRGQIALSQELSTPDESDATPTAESALVTFIRWQIWLYLILWFVEGALRKWFLPGLSNPLLIVRDPVVLGIYATALAANVFPMNRAVAGTLILAILSGVAGFLVTGNLPLTAFGVRSNFLHLPLIYVMAAVLRPIDLRRIGFLLLAGSVPMALIMVKQFQSGIDSWWNLGAGGGRQLISVEGRIRAAGTFSFISGPVAYFAISAAFLVASGCLKRWYRWWILLPSAAATILAAAVAGSRSLLANLAIVVVFVAIGLVRNPQHIPRIRFVLGVSLVAFICVSALDVYQVGREITQKRATSAQEHEGGFEGFVNRAVEQMIVTPDRLGSLKLLGAGLGSGTLAARALVTEDRELSWGETEWDRVLMESGPILGLAYLLLRAGIVVSAFFACYRVSAHGNLLALALYGAAGYTLLTGQFGQPTSQGAATIAMGLCLAALSLKQADLAVGDGGAVEQEAPEHLGREEGARVKIRRGRAQHAVALHERNPDNGV